MTGVNRNVEGTGRPAKIMRCRGGHPGFAGTGTRGYRRLGLARAGLER